MRIETNRKFAIEIIEKKKKLPIMPTMLRANEAVTIFYCNTKTKDVICEEDEE
jgi:hypothetical protein